MRRLDEETGNYYYGARYYDPKLSIFISVDPLAESTMDAYGYYCQNPIKLIDPTGMEGDDWIYNKVTEEYQWDSTVNEPTDVCSDTYEYVGKSINDVEVHYKENNPITSLLFDPKFGEEINAPWPGELTTQVVNAIDKWAESDNIFAEISYGSLNDFYVTAQSFNPFQNKNYITTLSGNGVNDVERTESGVFAISSFMPVDKGVEPILKVMNASKFSKIFKGTFLTKTSHALRGLYNRTFNNLIRFINILVSKTYGETRRQRFITTVESLSSFENDEP